MEPSEIQQFFSGSTILVTGATGFLGKVLVEKLLRTCYELKRLYILVRPKKNKTPQMRFEQYFDDPLYDRLKAEQPKSLEKLYIISGDCELPNLGLGDSDIQTIISEVNCIFHVAAAVRFNENLRKATYINVKATRDVLSIARKVYNLKSIVHVSTAFSFCPRQKIDEVFYQPGIQAEDLLMLVDSMDEKLLDSMTPILLKKWPNTYAFTKAVAEDLINRKSAGLPIAIVRPSIVMITAKEPVAGWIDNYYGATGVSVGVVLGVIRTMCYEASCVSDQVPADYAVNNIIAAAWNVGNNRNTISTEVFPTDVPIYNYVCGAQNPITWAQCTEYGRKHIKSYPSMHMQWHFFFHATSSMFNFLIYHFILHLIPAYAVDLAMFVSGKKPRLVKTYKKIKETTEILSFFTTKTWSFRNQNTQALWCKLSKKDKELFEFDMKLIDWDAFYRTFIYGTRIYLLKDPLDTLERAKSRAFILKVAHYFLVAGFVCALIRV